MKKSERVRRHTNKVFGQVSPSVHYNRGVAVETLEKLAAVLDVETAAIVDQAKTQIEKLIQMEASK